MTMHPIPTATEDEAADVAFGADDPRGRDGADVLALGG